MKLSDLFDLYCKERDYQRSIFGSYSSKKVLNISSFISFLEHYVKECNDNYCEPWVDLNDPILQDNMLKWFKSSIEMEMQGAAPILVYETLIKIFALSGAALETYLEMDVDKWRNDGIKHKWCTDKTSESK